MKDITIVLANRPGTIADAAEALGEVGINIAGGCGFPAAGEGLFHVLVEDAERARKALEERGMNVRDERDVVVVDVAPQPGALGKVLSRIADAGVNVDLIYATQDGQIVLGADDVDGAQRAVAS